jgi:hypothetical protein
MKKAVSYGLKALKYVTDDQIFPQLFTLRRITGIVPKPPIMLIGHKYLRECIEMIRREKHNIFEIKLNNEGDLAVSACKNGSLIVWGLMTSSALAVLDEPDCICFDINGKGDIIFVGNPQGCAAPHEIRQKRW